jgi:hypothetical protein
MSILSLAVFTAVRLLYYEVDLAASQVHGTRARHLAEMGIAVGTNQVIERTDPLLSQQFEGGLEGYEVRITSEGSQFNINALLANRGDGAPPDKPFLRELFTGWGLDQDFTEELVDALVDWVDADDLEENNGAEKQDYEAMGYLNRPFNRPFYSLEEMRQVRGMDDLEFVYPDWRSWFTIWSNGGLDVNEADPELIAAAAEVTIDEAESVRDHVVGPDGIRGNEDDLPFGSSTEVMDYLGVPDIQRMIVEPRLAANDPTSRIESVGWSGDIRRKIVLIVRNRNSGRPSILERKEELIP